MWRAIPLLKMAIRMVVYCTALVVVSQILTQVVVVGAKSAWSWWSWRSWLWTSTPVNILYQGVTVGLALALPMALVTIIFFRQIRRPAYYQFTMMTVALIAAIALWVGPALEALHGIDLFQPWRWHSGFMAPVVISIGSSVLAIYSSRIAAGKYVRETAALAAP